MLLKTFMLAILSLCSSAMPTTERTAISSAATVEDIQLLHPHVISIERFQSLLRRAGEIFRPMANDAEATTESPYEFMQPPADEAFDYYQPLFERSENIKMNAKSRQLENLSPPPISNNLFGANVNYYALKPKKLPKKFNDNAKHVNLKWLNAFEKAATGKVGELPKTVYMLSDERQRINFDDSFFAVDMQIKMPNNELYKEVKPTDSMEDAVQQPEYVDTEDLMAVAAAQLPQVRQNYALLTQ